MNLGELKERCKARYRDPRSILTTAEVWVDHLNFVYGEFCRAAQWPFLEDVETYSVAVGERSVDLGAESGQVREIFNRTSGDTLYPVVDRAYWYRLYEASTERGDPMWFHLRGRTLLIFPVASRTTDLDVIQTKIPAPLVADSDEPVIPAAYQEALVAGSVAKAMTDDDDDRYSRYRTEYDSLLAGAMQDLLGSRYPGYTEVTDTFWRGA